MDPNELSTCYEKHHRHLYLVALAVTMDRQAAEDAVHDALERLLRKRRRPDDPVAYVTQAVRNAAIDLVRQRRAHETDLDEVFEAPRVESGRVSPRLLAAALANLRGDERETIWLHLYADMSFREIAVLRGRSLNTIASWYRRGITKLRQALEVEHDPAREGAQKARTARTVG